MGNIHRKGENVTSSGLSKQRKKAAGLCVECGKPAREGRTTCAECARKKCAADKRRREALRGASLAKRPGPVPVWEYVAWRGRQVVFRGTSREVAEYFGMTQKAVIEYCRRGIRRKKDMVFFERSLIQNGNV